MPRFSKPATENEHGEIIMPGAYGAAPGGFIERRSTFEWDNDGRALINVDELSVELSDDEEEGDSSQPEGAEDASQSQSQSESNSSSNSSSSQDEELGLPPSERQCSNRTTLTSTESTNNEDPGEHVIPIELLDADVTPAPPPTLYTKLCQQSTFYTRASRMAVVVFLAVALAVTITLVFTQSGGKTNNEPGASSSMGGSSSSSPNNSPTTSYLPPSSSLAESRSELGIQQVIQEIVSADKLEPNWNSPYWEALYWILYEDPLQLTPSDATVALQQRYLMAAFYYATSVNPKRLATYQDRNSRRIWKHCAVPHYDNNDGGFQLNDSETCTHWVLTQERPVRRYEPQQPLAYKWLSGVSECQWAGVQCNDDGHVTDIVLAGYGLTGSLIEELASLQSLQKLSLPYNDKLEGTIPSSLFGLVHTLELQYNQHNGALLLTTNKGDGNGTSVVEEDSALEILNLAGNALTGRLSSGLQQLTNLRQVSLQENELTGTLPSTAQWPRLELLRAQQNLFSGTIPTTLVGNVNLRELDLSYNGDVSGTIPSEIGLSTKLQTLNMGNAQLTGTLPLELYDCTRLRKLDLHQNELNGTMATEIGKLTKLQQLLWQNNKFEGMLPVELAELTSIDQFHINGNDFVGEVPKPFCDLHQDGFPLSLSVHVVADCTVEEDSVALECPNGCCSQCCQKSTGECTANPFAILGLGNRTGNTP